MSGCVCGGVPLNTGTSGCIEQIKTWEYLMRVDQQDSTGAYNYIPLGTDLTEVYVKAKLNNTDPTVKWTIFPRIWQVEDVRGDSLKETIDNVEFVEDQGPRTFSAFMIGKQASPQMLAAWESFACRSNAVYGLTSAGQIEGNNPDLAGDLYPIKVQDETWDAIYIKPSKAPSKQKIAIKFTIDETEEDATLDFISSASITYPTANWYGDAPIDVVGYEVAGGASTTQVIIKMKERFGSVKKNDISGLVTADFSPDNGVTPGNIYNTTSSANVALSGVTVATVAGELQYTLTFPAQTALDVVSIDIFKEGLDMRDALLITL